MFQILLDFVFLLRWFDFRNGVEHAAMFMHNVVVILPTGEG
jgi:hypothetical protein